MCRTGPSSWQRQHAPAPAERPSDQRQVPARVTPPPGTGREHATMGHRSPPSRHTTERFQFDSRRGPPSGASNSQAPGGLPTLHRSTIGTSSSTSGTVLARLFLSVSTSRAPPLANTVRVSRRRHRGPWADEGDYGDRFIYQGLDRIPSGHAAVISPSGQPPQDQDKRAQCVSGGHHSAPGK